MIRTSNNQAVNCNVKPIAHNVDAKAIEEELADGLWPKGSELFRLR